MNRLLPALLLLAACPQNTKEDKGSAPAKSDDGAKGGTGEEGKQTGDAAAQATVDAGGGGESTLYIVNLTTDYDICFAYADTCDGAESGELLGDYYLPPDFYLEVSGLPDDCYDLWAFDCDDSAVWAYETDIAGEFTWILTQSGGGNSGDTGGGGGQETG
jgi:hypothetical protein